MNSKQAEKETGHVEVESNGDICNRTVFRQTIITKLIPLLRTKIYDIFRVIFIGDDWKIFLHGDSIIEVSTFVFMYALGTSSPDIICAIYATLLAGGDAVVSR